MGKSAFKTINRALDSELGREVAWNTISLKNLTPAEMSNISKQLKINHQLKHKNIICMNTVWINRPKEELVIISEIITGGSLKKYLLRLRQPRLKLIKQWCRGILFGLDYLHSQKPPLVHGDLTSDNIYIMSCDGTVKISDSYHNKLVSSTSSVMGNPEYMAPEVFTGESGTHTDIYSFGMALLEMCTQLPPYREHTSLAKVYSCIKEGVLPQALATIQDPEIVEIIKSCLGPPELRPTARQLLANRVLDVNELPKNLLPVPIKACGIGRTASSDLQSVHISLVVMCKGRCPKDISFDYCNFTDTPEGVAKEMVDNFLLDHNLVIKIAEIIEKKIEAITLCKEKPAAIKIFRNSTDVVEPNTAWKAPETTLPRIKSSNSCGENFDTLSTSETIKSIQQLVSKIFAVKLNCDGFNGKKTMMLIKKFQQQEGVIPNGIASEELIKLLTHRISQNN